MGGLIWLASYPRSGNTWARVFLHNLLNAIEGNEAQDINELDEISTWDIADKWYRPFLKKAPNEVSKEQVAAQRPNAQQSIAASVDGLVFVKTHAALVMDRGTPTIDLKDTAGAIYLVRNPLDVVLSYAKHMGITTELAVDILNKPKFETPNGPNSVYEFYGSWSQHVTSWTRRPHKAIYIQRYEDLIVDPVKNFTKMANHLRMNATPAQIEVAVEQSSFERLSSSETEQGFKEKPDKSVSFFRKGTAGQWKDELEPSLIDKIIDCHHTIMNQYDYLP